MGDALSRKKDLDFLIKDTIKAIQSDSGRLHLWLWLTKRPTTLAKLADMIGGFPPNVCAMTTVTSPEKLYRVSQLREVNAATRGLSIEPLWERIPPDELDLKGIDWVICGGESGCEKHCRPIDLNWARELQHHCQSHGVAFFLKQLGSKLIDKGDEIDLKHSHGGDWHEWPEDLRIREFPTYFYQYREHWSPASGS